jgi:hypothetical protein
VDKTFELGVWESLFIHEEKVENLMNIGVTNKSKN